MGEKKVPRVRESFFFLKMRTSKCHSHWSGVNRAITSPHGLCRKLCVGVLIVRQKTTSVCFHFFLFPDGNNRLKTSQRWRRKEEGGLSIVFLGWQRIKHLYSIIKVCDHKIIKWNKLFIVWCLKSLLFFGLIVVRWFVAKGTFTQHNLCVYIKINIFRWIFSS